MTPITIEAIETKQTELGALIQKFKEQSQTRVLQIAARTITLQPGESYAGARHDAQGNFLHDTIVMAARTDESYTFDGAQAWAQSVSGDCPSLEEAALIKANCPEVVTRWTWSNKPHADDASGAWSFHSDGLTHDFHKSAQGGALAVRRA